MTTDEERRRQLKHERRRRYRARHLEQHREELRRYRARQPSRLVILDESQDPSEIQALVPQEEELKS